MIPSPSRQLVASIGPPGGIDGIEVYGNRVSGLVEESEDEEESQPQPILRLGYPAARFQRRTSFLTKGKHGFGSYNFCSIIIYAIFIPCYVYLQLPGFLIKLIKRIFLLFNLCSI